MKKPFSVAFLQKQIRRLRLKFLQHFLLCIKLSWDEKVQYHQRASLELRKGFEMFSQTKMIHSPRQRTLAGLLVCILIFVGFRSMAATFPGNADLTVSDPTGALSWKAANNALSVQCWFKISIPSGTNLTQNMVILANGTSGSESQYAYLVRFNIANGNVEFVAQGGSGGYTNTLIQLPYLERWYHFAIVQSGAMFTGYIDGRQVFSSSGSVGNTANSSGISIGGWGSGQYLFGEVQEVSVYQNALSQDFIVQYMFDQQPTNDLTTGLVGYFPIGYSTNAASELANFAPPTVPNEPASAAPQGVGMVTFAETDESGEQSSYDAQRNGGRDALVPLSGAFSWQQTAFARPTPGVAMDFKFGYSSANSFGGFQLGGINPYSSGSLGSGWRSTFEARAIPSQTFSPLGDADSLGLMRWDGSIETWDLNYDTGQYQTRDNEYNGELIITTTNCQWTTPERLVYVFTRPDSGANFVMRGRLTAIHDFNGNSVQILWNQTSGVITQVVDSANGIYKFNYQGNLLTNVTFGSWLVNFSYDATNRLASKSITNTAGLYGTVASIWQFQYETNGLLSRIIDPRGNTNTFVQYDQYGRQTNQVDALGRATATRYEIPGDLQITRIDPATNSWVETYDRKGHTLSQTDPFTNTTSYTYDTNGNRTSVTEPLGWTMTFGYDNRANVIAKTNALGEITTWLIHPFFNKPVQQITPQPPDANGVTAWTNFYAYDAGGNLTNHSDALGTLVSYTYSTNGLVLTSTDANGNTTHFGYDTNGFLVSRTDPATNTTTYAVNDVGWKLRETDALGEPASYAYDLNGNANSIQDALGRTFTKSFDADGNLLSQSDGKQQLTTFAYDLANQKTNMVDRTGTNRWNYFYTSRGKLDHVTDPLGNSVTNIYDAANRLIQVTDPLGHSVTNQYDANGNLILFFDKTGQRWTKTYDRLDRVVAESDPLGDVKNTAYDVADRVQQITSPNGYPSLHTYDGRGRLIKWVDPMNFPWLYAYDGVGNITNITDALNGHYIMAYGLRNERTLEKNQDGFVWQYVYDQLVRLKQQTDPDSITRTPSYDPVGRVQSVAFSTGRSDSYSYDDNDNPRSISRSAAGVTTTMQFTYDPMDRVVSQFDSTTFQNVQYAYDALGRLTALTYPFGRTLLQRYDALNRLTNQVDWAGHQTFYSYDNADRLVSRTYPNGVVQTNTFDSAGRIAALSYSPSSISSNSINVALTYAYDRNGNKTGGGESGTFNWPQPPLTDDQSSFTPAGRLINRAITQPSATNSQQNVAYHYDASGNMTNAVMTNGLATVQSWTLAYDEDNRTTSIQWISGATNRLVANLYDALGRRISKSVNGATTSYVLELSGGMERVLCDLNSDATVNYYVHGPDLCYKIDSNGNITCFHADAQGNIIALTDGNANLVAQYAYTPYGRSLGSTNFQSQISNPYLFVGSQGVQQESDIPNLYFMRARYYSADAGVFLSTDSVKHIGSGWEPAAYVYANNNSLSGIDPNGTEPISDLIAFNVGLYSDIVYQLYKNRGIRNFNGWEPIIVGGTDAAATEAAVDTAGVAAAAGLGSVVRAAAGISAGALVSGVGNVVQQIQSKGIQAVNLTEASISVLSGVISGSVGEIIPAIPMKGQFMPQDLNIYAVNQTVQSSAETLIDGGVGQLTGAVGGNSSGNQSLSSQTVGAMCYASTVTAATSTPRASPTTQSGTTTASGGTSVISSSSASSNRGSSGSATSTQTASQSPANSSTSFLGQVGNIISTVATSVGNFFRGLF
jgi:RHS repeat-associated protein